MRGKCIVMWGSIGQFGGRRWQREGNEGLGVYNYPVAGCWPLFIRCGLLSVLALSFYFNRANSFVRVAGYWLLRLRRFFYYFYH